MPLRSSSPPLLGPALRLAALAALWLAAVAALGGCRGQQTPAAASGDATPKPVVAATVTQRTWPRVVTLQGNLMGDEQAVIGARSAGQVRKVCVDLGTQVAEGQVLAELDMRDFDLRVAHARSQLSQARAKLGLAGEGDKSDEEKLDPQNAAPVVEAKALWEEAEANLARARALARTDAVSDEEMQLRETASRVAQARHDSALNNVREQIAALAMHRAELDMALEAQANATVRAPFAGVVAARQASPGVYLQIGAPVVTLVRIDPLRFRAGAPEREARHLKVGQQAVLRIEGQQQPRTATISRLSPVLDLASRSLMVEIDIPNAGVGGEAVLQGGLFAECDIVVDAQSKTLAAPQSAVIEFAGVQKAWILKDGQAQSRKVVTGRTADGFVEILEGLEASDQIALDAARVAPGPVTIVAADSKVARASSGGERETEAAE